MTGQTVGVRCNGKTVDFDSTALGSIPGTPAINSYMNITKFPVLITSPARCGSTALLRKIAFDYNLKEFGEPHALVSPKVFWKLTEFSKIKKRSDYVIKVMSGLFDYYHSYYNYNLDNFFTIRLRRRNIIEQCASYYIARTIDKWHSTIHDFTSLDFIALDYNEIKLSTDLILQANIKNEAINHNFNLELYYEDLDLSNPDLVKNSKPKNYQELLDIIKADIDQR